MNTTTEQINSYIEYLNSKTFISSVVVIIIAFVLLWLIKQYLIKKVAYSGKDEQHKNTFIGMIFNVLQYLVVLISVVVVLKMNGVNIGSILAGLGIVATIVGLALQDTLKDIISGINIYNNNFYKVGDMVRWNGEECDVKYFSARVTKFQSIMTGSTYTVCNSQITSIEKIKDQKVLGVLFKFSEDKKKIDEAFNEVVIRMQEECEDLKDITYIGLWSIEQRGVEYGFLYHCPAHKYLPVVTQLVQIIYDECKKAEIRPTFHRDFLV